MVSERTTITLHGCRFGLLPSGLSLLGEAAAPERGLATAFAVGATPLNAHDATRVLSARYAPAADTPGEGAAAVLSWTW